MPIATMANIGQIDPDFKKSLEEVRFTTGQEVFEPGGKFYTPKYTPVSEQADIKAGYELQQEAAKKRKAGVLIGLVGLTVFALLVVPMFTGGK